MATAATTAHLCQKEPGCRSVHSPMCRTDQPVLPACCPHGPPPPAKRAQPPHLQVAHHLHLLRRQHLSEHRVHLELSSDGMRGACVVAGEHAAAHALLVQRRHDRRRLWLQRVSDA
eukprot:364588-Chlamydomonas_euryale.AAC.11